MPSARLFETYLEVEGIRSTNFFNGRLLTGEDMQQEQAAARAALLRLGRATVEGIAHGLQVTAMVGGGSREDPVVTVARGLAIARDGQAISLANPVSLSLLDTRARNGGEAPPPAGDYDACGGPSGGVTHSSQSSQITVASAKSAVDTSLQAKLAGSVDITFKSDYFKLDNFATMYADGGTAALAPAPGGAPGAPAAGAAPRR